VIGDAPAAVLVLLDARETFIALQRIAAVATKSTTSSKSVRVRLE